MLTNVIEMVYPGERIKDVSTLQEYRILTVNNGIVTVCLIDEPNHSQLKIRTKSLKEILRMLNGDSLIKIEEPKDTFLIEHLNEAELERYQKRVECIQELKRIYGPTWVGLSGKKAKPEYLEICSKYDLNPRNMRRWVSRYVQSGCNKNSLISIYCNNKKRSTDYQFKAKNGRKNLKGNPKTGIPLSKKTIESFNIGLNILINGVDGRKKGANHTTTYAYAYKMMIVECYNEFAATGQGDEYKLLPEDQRPTYRQFVYYCKKHLSKEQLDKIKTSGREVRNNGRLLKSDTVRYAQGPMDLVEIDAWEADVDLLSSSNKNLVVGRPTVYAMVDAYSKMIVAVSITFDRDSYVGLTNLFLNIVDPVEKQVENLGLIFEYLPMPNGCLPNTVRTDNGSDFICENFDEMCNRMNIMHETVPAATGSLKPNVERLWGRIRELTEKALENHGAILKRNDNNSKKTAILTIDEYAAIVYTAALGLNQREMPNYPATKEMLTYRDAFGNPLSFRPDSLWKYGIEEHLAPRKIQNKTQFYLDLMVKDFATLSRDGIRFKDLPYWPKEDDKEMLNQLYVAGTKRVSIPIHYDPRSMNYIWYVDANNELHVLTLNQAKSIAIGMNNLTLKEVEKYKEARANAKANATVKAISTDAAIHAGVHTIVNQAVESRKDIGISSKNIRANHEIEKNKTRHKNAIASRLGETTSLPDNPNLIEPPKKQFEIDDGYDFEGDYTDYIKNVFNS